MLRYADTNRGSKKVVILGGPNAGTRYMTRVVQQDLDCGPDEFRHEGIGARGGCGYNLMFTHHHKWAYDSVKHTLVLHMVRSPFCQLPGLCATFPDTIRDTCRMMLHITPEELEAEAKTWSGGDFEAKVAGLYWLKTTSYLDKLAMGTFTVETAEEGLDLERPVHKRTGSRRPLHWSWGIARNRLGPMMADDICQRAEQLYGYCYRKEDS